MGELDRDQLRALWRAMAERNGWALADDDEAFLDKALAIYRTRPCQKARAQCLRYSLQCAYAELLYDGARRRQPQACQELLAAFLRLSLRAGLAPNDAEDVAQESFARVLGLLHQLQAPQSFLFWALRLRCSVQREHFGAAGQAYGGLEAQELVDPFDLADAVEQRIVTQTLLAALRSALGRDLEVLVVVRSVCMGETPREIARQLGLEGHYVRVIKSRSMQRLAGNALFVQALRELVGDGNRAAGEGGEHGASADE